MFWCETVPNPMCESHRYGARRQQAAGIEVEVLLRVGADATGRRQQERHVGEQREPDELEPSGAARRRSRGRRSVRHLHERADATPRAGRESAACDPDPRRGRRYTRSGGANGDTDLDADAIAPVESPRSGAPGSAPASSGGSPATGCSWPCSSVPRSSRWWSATSCTRRCRGTATSPPTSGRCAACAPATCSRPPAGSRSSSSRG